MQDSTVNAALAQRLSSPNQFSLVTSTDGKKTNVMALSWWSYCSNRPLTVSICVGKKAYTNVCLKYCNEFCLCLPGTQLQEGALEAGKKSGRDTDKTEQLGFKMKKADSVSPPFVDGCRLVLECRVNNTVEVSDHNMYIAEVVAMHSDAGINNLMAYDGYSVLGPACGLRAE